MIRKIFLLALLFHGGCFEVTKNIKLRIRTYESNLNTSIELEKDDIQLRESWALDFQVKRISVTTKYRLEMMRQEEHVFHNMSHKWSKSVHQLRRQIRKLTKDYNTQQSECLISTASDKERTRGVDQVEKEIRKWRKGYRYLTNTCNSQHLEDNEAAGACLVEYMEKDSYNIVIQRLIILKLEAMELLFVQMTTNLKALEECLKTKLSTQIEKVKNIMDAENNLKI